MANFLGIFKTVAKDVGVVAQYGSFGISAFNPALGAIVSKIGSAIVQVESQIPEDNSGANQIPGGHPGFQREHDAHQRAPAVAQAGKTMTWDAGKLKDVIDAQTKALNLFHDLAASIKIVDTVQPTKPQ